MRALGAMVLGLSLGSVVMHAPAAQACWDGSLATVGDVTLQGGGGAWDRATVLTMATWLTRVDRLLPEGALLESWDGTTTLTLGERTLELAWRGGLPGLFRRVARAVGVSRAREASLARLPTPPVWTVQAGSFPSRAAAEARARLIDEGASCSQGFYEVGGFPAQNPATHLEASPDGRVFRVLVGAYLSRTEAEEHRACLAEIERGDGGLAPFRVPSFVRRLDLPPALAGLPPAAVADTNTR